MKMYLFLHLKYVIKKVLLLNLIIGFVRFLKLYFQMYNKRIPCIQVIRPSYHFKIFKFMHIF